MKRVDCVVGWMGRCVLLAFAFSLLTVAAPTPAQAQNLVVAKFTDKTRRKKMGKIAWAAIARALKDAGARIVSYEQYLDIARSAGIRKRKAINPAGVRQLAGQLDLAGVVTGVVKRKKKWFVVNVRFIDASGNVAWKRTFRPRRPIFKDEKAALVAEQVMQFVGSSQGADQEYPPEDVAAIDPGGEAPPDPVEDTPPSMESDSEPSEPAGDEAFLPAWARGDGASNNEPSGVSGRRESSSVSSRASSSSSRSSRRTGKTPINDLLLSAGGSLHFRSGLVPRHEAMWFPGIRIDAHMFFGTFSDMSFLRDLGFGGMFDKSLFLQYRSDGGATATAWEASQTQWRAELLYRIPFQLPAFVIRAGYGTTSCIIASGSATNVRSAAYTAPHASLDVYLKFADWFRLYLSGGAMFMVAGSQGVGGTGLGINGGVGMNMTISDMFHLGLGYELLIYLMEDTSTSGLGKYSDTYQSVFLRLGYNYQ